MEHFPSTTLRENFTQYSAQRWSQNCPPFGFWIMSWRYQLNGTSSRLNNCISSFIRTIFGGDGLTVLRPKNSNQSQTIPEPLVEARGYETSKISIVNCCRILNLWTPKVDSKSYDSNFAKSKLWDRRHPALRLQGRWNRWIDMSDASALGHDPNGHSVEHPRNLVSLFLCVFFIQRWKIVVEDYASLASLSQVA